MMKLLCLLYGIYIILKLSVINSLRLEIIRIHMNGYTGLQFNRFQLSFFRYVNLTFLHWFCCIGFAICDKVHVVETISHLLLAAISILNFVFEICNQPEITTSFLYSDSKIYLI